MESRVLVLLASLGIALASLAAPGQPAAAQEGGSLIIGVATCPEGYDGENYVEDCDAPGSGIDFTIASPNTDNTETTTSRGDGLVTFSLAPYDLDPTGPDRVSVGEPAADNLDYAVFCTKNGDQQLHVEYETIEFEPGGPLQGISFAFETGDDIGCEWYNIPLVTGTDAGHLPSTGTGAAANDARQLAFLPALATLLALAGPVARGLCRRLTV